MDGLEALYIHLLMPWYCEYFSLAHRFQQYLWTMTNNCVPSPHTIRTPSVMGRFVFSIYTDCNTVSGCQTIVRVVSEQFYKSSPK